MIEQVIIRLLSDQDLKKMKCFIVTTQGYYYGYILSYEEGVLQLEVETSKGRENIYIVLSRIVAIEMLQNVKATASSSIARFLEASYKTLGACQQHNGCCDIQDESVKHLFRMIKCTTSPEHVMSVKLENNSELMIQIKYLVMALKAITIFYQKNSEISEEELLIIINNAYVDSVIVSEDMLKKVSHHEGIEGKCVKRYK